MFAVGTHYNEDQEVSSCVTKVLFYPIITEDGNTLAEILSLRTLRCPGEGRMVINQYGIFCLHVSAYRTLPNGIIKQQFMLIYPVDGVFNCTEHFSLPPSRK